MSMMLISPYSRPLRNGGRNPKNYPYWQDFIDIVHKHSNIYVTQIGVGDEEKLPNADKHMFDLSLRNVWGVSEGMDVWLSVDNFYPHMMHYYGKPGIVVWGQSDPRLFGYEENINILKDRSYLRERQFWLWEQCEYREDVFVGPEKVWEAVKDYMLKHRIKF